MCFPNLLCRLPQWFPPLLLLLLLPLLLLLLLLLLLRNVWQCTRRYELALANENKRLGGKQKAKRRWRKVRIMTALSKDFHTPTAEEREEAERAQRGGCKGFCSRLRRGGAAAGHAPVPMEDVSVKVEPEPQEEAEGPVEVPPAVFRGITT